MSRILFIFLMFAGLACTDKENPVIMPAQPEPSDSNNNVNQDSTFYYLALGDSYTIGESVEENERFPVQLVEKLEAEGFEMQPAKIVARTGWTTDELAAAIKNENLKDSYNLVTLLIGVNNQYRGRSADEYRGEFRNNLQTAIKFAGNKAQNVIVVSIPDYGVTPFGQSRNPEQIAKEIDEYNAINFQETQQANARYVEITTISREALNDETLVASDGLHPSGEMYRRWVEKILPEAKKILESQK
ncbi:SGNH/GDSL hydrolase family protein [uncultured Draconibacterium sp.]|uniref:SGNH/GDSL hydrolase family protein n=1 Tax=uncultured Draconibacterium sp. TaxID=1573823 RepID=UPI0025FBE95E|nr:SGNH/GDSL hydrolase family protein [uncultured Draconibacterium sp.]